ncbi:MAG: ATP-binding cassette domain-containing protein [candidate division Zixibacteria bacterium]|nr:ATP-binding cassette domain-containing protein [candidate division Zixibacteria bacterium]
MAEVKLKNLTKRFKDVLAVNNVSLHIEDGEFLTLVGPSGCGKSTTLRAVAGLENPTAGDIFIDGQRVNDLPPQKRNISMVFQSYALFPHMSVESNLAFGMKIRKRSLEKKTERIKWVIDLLGLAGFEKRLPKELSGGQRQRVALGRALVLEPKVLLLDEPLSNLDAKLRLRMRTELKRLHKKIKTTIIYVTHDQAEAMTLSDRLAVMRDGKILQVGTPEEIYQKPADGFCAGFIGSPPMNFISGDRVPQVRDEKVTVGIRPEDFSISLTETGDGISGRSSVTETLGSDNYLYVDISDLLIAVRLKPEESMPEDRQVWLIPRKQKLHLFDKSTGRRVQS